jgi:hypothetical protein
MFHSWQDAVVSISNVFFSVTIILMLISPNTRVPRHSSIPTAIALSAMSFTFCTLALVWSATICGLNGLLWFAIAIWRPTRS